MLSWTKRFNIFCFLDNQKYSIQPQQYECLLAAGAADFVSSDNLIDIDTFLTENNNWAFGHLAYDLKNSIHHLNSNKENKIGFPPFFFFSPQILLQLKNDELRITAENADEIYENILSQNIQDQKPISINIQHRLTREEYLQKIKQLQQHIVRGDCYEINFCQEFFAGDVEIDPADIFQKLTEVSPNPFSALYRWHHSYLMCASPERFLAKKNDHIFSQPMKGTMRRDRNDVEADEQLKKELHESIKDRSENVMVVDMVRNDLTKVCKENSVKVDELFGVYTYPQVHQMISTISGQLKPNISFSKIIEATFPMGSMTGAPKHRVMELIDQYEVSSRGIFSGSVGYITPKRDFDFNVAIRSILYNSGNQYVSYQVGSGITFYSDPEKEWEECLLKAQAIKKVLTSETR